MITTKYLLGILKGNLLYDCIIFISILIVSNGVWLIIFWEFLIFNWSVT